MSLVLWLLTSLHPLQLYSSRINFVKAPWSVHFDKLPRNCFNYVFYITNLVSLQSVSYIDTFIMVISCFCQLEIKNWHRLQARYSKGQLEEAHQYLLSPMPCHRRCLHCSHSILFMALDQILAVVAAFRCGEMQKRLRTVHWMHIKEPQVVGTNPRSPLRHASKSDHGFVT